MKLKSYLFLAFAALAMTACNEDFGDWKQQATNEQEAAVTFGNDGAVAEVALIDFATIPEDQDSVQVCKITAPTSSYSETFNKYVLTLNANGTEKDFDLDDEGRVLTKDLREFVETNFGKNPNNTNVMTAVVTVYSGNGDTAVKNILATSGNFTIKAKVQAPFIDPDGYYIVGNIDGWKCTKIDEYHLVNNGGDVYENPVFTYTMPNDEMLFADITTFEIKLIPASAFNEDGTIGNWGIALSAVPGVDDAANSGSFAWDNSGGNIKFNAVPDAKFYKFTFDLLNGTYSVEAISFDPFIYFIGATDGWKNAEQKLALADNDGNYTGFLYCADPNGWGNQFKFQKVPGDWGTEINSGHMTGGITGDFADAGGNFEATAGEGVYYVKLNVATGTLEGVLINNMNLVGGFNGWNQADDAQQMTWNATDYCYEITDAGVTADGWKFTANNAWNINLGGEITNLVQDGGNLSVTGTTIKLYPTRKTSDNIYSTVE